MPLMRTGAAAASASVALLSFEDTIRTGQVVPIISDAALVSMVVGDYSALVRGYAQQRTKYALEDCDNLERIAKYRQLCPNPDFEDPNRRTLDDRPLKHDYLDWVKNFLYAEAEKRKLDQDTLKAAEDQWESQDVTEFARGLRFLDFEHGAAPALRVLADIRASTFITTSPYRFLEEALVFAGKQPQTELCRWKRELEDEPSIIYPTSAASRSAGAYEPSKDAPLVFHLHGVDTRADSLVLTEDDHLDYLVNVCQDQGNNSVARIPALVTMALRKTLLLLGYSLSGWPFRSLYASLLKRYQTTDNERGECVIQLPDKPEVKRYLEDYVKHDVHFRVEWGSLDDYASHIANLLGG